MKKKQDFKLLDKNKARIEVRAIMELWYLEIMIKVRMIMGIVRVAERCTNIYLINNDSMIIIRYNKIFNINDRIKRG